MLLHLLHVGSQQKMSTALEEQVCFHLEESSKRYENDFNSWRGKDIELVPGKRLCVCVCDFPLRRACPDGIFPYVWFQPEMGTGK